MDEPRAVTRDGWGILGMAYSLYVLLYMSSYFTRVGALNYLGALIVLYGVYLAGGFRLERGPALRLALFLLLWPFCGVVFSGAEFNFNPWFKQTYLLLLLIGMMGLDLGPLTLSPSRRWFAWPLAGILFLSFFTGMNSGRHSGVFTNANNFSLTAFGLLLLLDEARDPIRLRRAAHLFVVFILFLANTVGAFTGYMGATVLKYREVFLRPWRLAGWTAGMAAVVFLLTVTGWGGKLASLDLSQRVMGQWAVISSGAPDALSGSADFGSMARDYGAGSTSGLWRLTHWVGSLTAFGRSGPGTWTFGYGIGSFPGLFGNMAHNDYLRVLLEQGVVGFAAMGALLLGLVRKVPLGHRFGMTAFFIYCFSENNIDNVLFMSLFVMFLATAGKRAPQEAV